MTGNFLFDWLQLALSLFCCILLLWLGLTVLLNSEQRTGSVLLITATAFFGSIFFAAHTAILQFAGRIAAPSLDFWWQVGWLMLVALPYGWYVIVLWYGGYGEKESPLRQRHRLPAAVLGVLMAMLLCALLLASPLPALTQMIQLQPENVAALLGVPWFLVLYPLYMLACLGQALLALHDTAGVAAAELLGLARRRARPWLVATTALLGLVNGLVMAAIVWFHFLPRDGNTSPGAVLAGAAWFDLAVSLLLAAAIVLIGQAMVHFEIFSGRTLPRRELRRHWNYALVLAGGYGILVGGSLAYGLRPIYDLLLAGLLMAALFALTGWRTFQHQQAFVRRLQPFVTGTHLYAQLTGQPTGAEPPAPNDELAGRDTAAMTFAALCRDVLNTSYAALVAAGPLAMLVPKPLSYPPAAQAPAPGPWLEAAARATALCLPLRPATAPEAAWALPLRSDGECIGVLLLGERRDGSMYTEEEMEVARATGERLLDLRASAELALRLLKVQRTRLVESTVLDRQTRRVLHDDVLPELHTALLLLNRTPGEEIPPHLASDLAAAGDLLVNAHRRIAELLRTLPIGPAQQPEGGLLPALHRLLAGDFAGQFDQVTWQVSAEAETLAAQLPPVTAEVVFYALREVIRNAARHGRGGDEARALALRLEIDAADGLHIVVYDDGVGLADREESATTSSGQGLSLHAALLAVVGATLSVSAVPGCGAQVAIDLPAAVCGGA
jgi:signal transduction histidine kinase